MRVPLRDFAWNAAHRLVPSRYCEGGTILAEIAQSQSMLRDIVVLDGATDERAQGEQHGLVGIGIFELVYGVPHAHLVNAAFTHANEEGSRFNDRTRGAWYAAEERETSVAEVTYHRARRLAAIVAPELPEPTSRWRGRHPRRWLAGFRAGFHLLDPPAAFADCLLPEPVPQCY